MVGIYFGALFISLSFADAMRWTNAQEDSKNAENSSDSYTIKSTNQFNT